MYCYLSESKVSCLNFWDEAWFLSLRVFRLLSSSLLLFPQRFGRYVLWPSSGVCRTREPSRNFELRPLTLVPKVPEFDKHLKKAGRHIGWNIVNDKNHQALSQKFRQLRMHRLKIFYNYALEMIFTIKMYPSVIFTIKRHLKWFLF